MPGLPGGLNVGQGVGADPPEGFALWRDGGGDAVAQAALAVPHAGLSTADVHRGGRAGAGGHAHHDPATGMSCAVGGGRARSGRGGDDTRGVVADSAAGAGGLRAAGARRARTHDGAGHGRDPVGRPRWLPEGSGAQGPIRWRRTDPWETGFVDLVGDQALLGQVDGRTSAAVRRWLLGRSATFRDAIEVVVIDPHAGYAAAVRAVLPNARIAVDHFHLIMLANRAVTAVRQRITRDLLGRRGRAIDPAWANRRLLLRGRERLSERALARMWNGCIDHDPTGSILTAWIAKEELRALCATAARGGHRDQINQRLWTFYTWCADAEVPELTTLAETIETWWPAIEEFLTTGLTNARTEGTNRLIKQVKRAACGFRNRDNYRRRVRLHCTRQTRRLSARNPTAPA